MVTWMIILLIILGSLAIIALPFLIIFLVNHNFRRVSEQTDWLSDAQLLHLINQQPDKIVSANMLSQITDLTKGQARNRLGRLHLLGVLKQYWSNITPHYSLWVALKDPHLDPPSNDYLSLDMLLKLFEQYDYRLNIAQIIYSTGLSATTIQKEMKSYLKDGVVKYLKDALGKKMYTLQEPYRSNPSNYLNDPPALLDSATNTGLKLVDLDIIELAMKRDGRIDSESLSEVQNLGKKEAEAMLLNLVERDFFDTEEMEDGQVIYVLKN